MIAFSIYFLGISNCFLSDSLSEADFLNSKLAFEMPDLGNLAAYSQNQLLAFFGFPLLFIILNAFILNFSNLNLIAPPSSKKSFVLRC